MTGLFLNCPSLQYIDVFSFIWSFDGTILLSDFQANTGELLINENFYKKLQVKPNNNWKLNFNKTYLLELI